MRKGRRLKWENDRTKILRMKSMVQIDTIIEKMVSSGLRRRTRDILIHQLVLLILSLKVIDVLNIVIVIGHRVPSIRLV